MNKEKIQSYWETRAASDPSISSTTEDIYLRDIEFRQLSNLLEKKMKVKTVMDVGCGDGYTTCRLAKDFPDIQFVGSDYSESMIKNAMRRKNEQNLQNIEFKLADISNTEIKNEELYDVIYTTRCLINLPTYELQKIAINNIVKKLRVNGFYFMIENFEESQQRFAELRKQYELPEIPIREHNHFFNLEATLRFLRDKFEILNVDNISSSYYIVSRIIYSKICQVEQRAPDYSDIHHQLAAELPFIGDFGPVQCISMRKI
jgi:ubiquinone/menaquinone biosynthesis C-methylase UbiE